MANVISFKVAGSRIESPPPVGGYESYARVFDTKKAFQASEKP
jgi:hypothetical protein